VKDCKLLEQCRFFHTNMADMPTSVSLLKTRYCKGGGSSGCARYIVYKKLGVDHVPETLLPNQLDRLEEILGFQ
jgi:hypothetical protein